MSDSSDDDQDTRKIKKTVDFQRIQLEKLMKNPEQELIISIAKEDKKPRAFEPHEFVRNVMGASAGAGSGEFDIYRGCRRRQMIREEYTKEQAEFQRIQEEFEKKRLENIAKAEEKTAKKREKRMKRKGKSKAKKQKSSDNAASQEDDQEDDDDDEEIDLTEKEAPVEIESTKEAPVEVESTKEAEKKDDAILL